VRPLDDRDYISVVEASKLGPFSPRDIRRKIKDGILVEGVHYTRPHGAHTIIVKSAFIRWLAGDDGELRKPAARARRPRCDFDLVGGL
jgi:hypothetical protein